MGSDLFAFGINYNDTQYGGASLYNGNIAETAWKTANDNTLRRYRYEYDALNRLELAAFNLGDNSQPHRYSTSNITYDKNGNILTLTRKGHTNAGATSFGNMDVLDYDYHNSELSNKLYKVRDDGNDSYGFKDSTADSQDYWYDANGNLTSDANKGITDIDYNYLNVPTKITVSGSNSGTIDFIYDAEGIKLQKTKTEGSVTTKTDYAGSFIYENGSLQFFSNPEGYVQPDGSGNYDYVYQYVDNIGNVRLSYTDADGNGSIDPSSEIIEESNFYPYGMIHEGYNEVISSSGNSTAQKWKFEGQELNEDLSLDVYEWKYRVHDPSIGRFWQLDPLAEDYSWMTTYQFSSNQPIHAAELEGLESSADLNQDRWNRQLLGGEITKEEFLEIHKANAGGGAIATGLVADALFTKGAITKNLLKQVGVQTAFNVAEQGLSGEDIDVGSALTEGAGDADLFDASLDLATSKLIPGGKVTEKAIETLVASTVDVTSEGGVEIGGINKDMTDVAVDFSFSVATDKVKEFIPNMKISGNKTVQKAVGKGVDFVSSQVRSAVQSPSTRRQSSTRQDPRLFRVQAQDNTKVDLNLRRKL
ncbi:RHS repeat domain-containing protein [Poritiphilus flavus]|uniref:RHS repeat-associated core domain-containing protein n=1 Tax=Poritiphilus flavus TaxID=2697053 RepID=A0A6L9EEA8_9FLAO|nr:RHS repeat-associated core domain-containing protein [Poritiphilus flavus]NAS12669.1 hypothetical protein [Poritiphilus flavus]